MPRLLTRWLLVAVACVLVLAAQVGVLPFLRLPYATPDLVLVVVIGVALAAGEYTGMLVGFAGGLAVDIVPPAVHAIGTSALVLCLLGYVAGRARRLRQRSALRTLLFVGVLAGCATLLTAAVDMAIGDGAVGAASLWLTALAAAGYDVVLGAFVIPLLLRVARRFGPRHETLVLDPARVPGTWSGGRVASQHEPSTLVASSRTLRSSPRE
jgi:rod shape-determining protein MreD